MCFFHVSMSFSFVDGYQFATVDAIDLTQRNTSWCSEQWTNITPDPRSPFTHYTQELFYAVAVAFLTLLMSLSCSFKGMQSSSPHGFRCASVIEIQTVLYCTVCTASKRAKSITPAWV